MCSVSYPDKKINILCLIKWFMCYFYKHAVCIDMSDSKHYCLNFLCCRSVNRNFLLSVIVYAYMWTCEALILFWNVILHKYLHVHCSQASKFNIGTVNSSSNEQGG